MKEISVKQISEEIAKACAKMACIYQEDILKAIQKGKENETDDKSKYAMDMLLENAKIAKEENIPICQDTGMVIVYAKIGQDVHLVDGLLNEAIQEGVRKGYTDNYLRASVVDDPLFDRNNTKDNTPAIIYTEIVEGDEVIIELTAKGFGSENMSQIKMLKPAEGLEGVKQFVLSVIEQAGPNACPPMIVGVGIGGSFDYAAYLSKKALLRPLAQSHPDERYAQLEKDLLENANELLIGPMGLHGKTTALAVHIESFPTHIAGLPCAVNICCHACRHEKVVIR